MKIFLTGATGYIGNRLMRTILAKGHEVHTILRDPAKQHHLEAAGVQIFKGDLSDKDNLARAMEGCEQAFHTAALARLWAADHKPFIETNVKGTEHVMQAAAEQGVRKVVFTSSASILAPYNGKMLDEGDHRKDGFESEYARTKHMAGQIVQGYVSAKMDAAIVIPTRVYGAGIMTHSNAISRMLDDLMKRNTSFVPACLDVVANYVYVEDVVNGHLLAMEKATGGESYILGGENISYRAFYDAVSDFTGKNNLLKMPLWLMKAAGYVNLAQYHLFKKDPAFTPDIIGRFFRNIHVSSEKAVRELGYEITPFREGLAETIKSLKSQDIVR